MQSPQRIAKRIWSDAPSKPYRPARQHWSGFAVLTQAALERFRRSARARDSVSTACSECQPVTLGHQLQRRLLAYLPAHGQRQHLTVVAVDLGHALEVEGRADLSQDGWGGEGFLF